MIAKLSTMKLKVNKLSKFIHKLLVNKIVHKEDIKEFELQSLRVKCEEVEKLLDIK